MVPVSAFYSRLMLSAPGCSEPLAKQALLDAAISFCERSLLLTRDLDPVNVVAGAPQYDLDLPPQHAIASVLNVWVDNRRLMPIARESIDDVDQTPGEPQYFYGEYADGRFALRLFPTPYKSYPDSLRVRAALKPTRAAAQVDSVLFEDWSAAIVNGALATVLAIPGQDFTNDVQSGIAMKLAQADVTKARADSARVHIRSSLRVTPRAF